MFFTIQSVLGNLDQRNIQIDAHVWVLTAYTVLLITNSLQQHTLVMGGELTVCSCLLYVLFIKQSGV